MMLWLINKRLLLCMVFMVGSVHAENVMLTNLGRNIAADALPYVLNAVVGDAIQAVRSIVRMYKWCYNTIFPHVDNIEVSARRIESRLNEINKKAQILNNHIQEYSDRLLTEIKQLPDIIDVEDALVSLQEMLITKQKLCGQALNEKIVPLEGRLNEWMVDFEEDIVASVRQGRQKIEQGACGARDRKQTTQQKLASIIQDTQKVVDDVVVATTLSQVTQHEH